MTTLPCFIGDADPLLVRAPGADLHMYGTVWLLTQGETRRRSACGSSPSSYPQARAYAPLLGDCPYRATDARQVAGDACRNPVGRLPIWRQPTFARIEIA